MKNIRQFSLAAVAGLALSAASSPAQEPLRQDESVANIGLFRTFGDSTGAAPTSDGTLLFTRGAACPPPNSLTPILAPDGHQVTWAEWNNVQGRAAVKCLAEGSHVVVHLSGLVPNGQYSAWIVAFKPPGFNPDPMLPNPPAANAVTAGPLGAQDGSQNGFLADDEGEGQIAYHVDGSTHGPVQGPPCTWAVQRIFSYEP